MSRTNRWFVIIGTAVLVVWVFGTLIWLANAPAVLRRSETKDPLSGYPTEVVLNPLRDRTPERSADHMLHAMAEGKCREQLAAWLRDYRQQYADFVCKSEQEHPLVSWSLFDREEQPPLMILHYRAKRKDTSGNYREDLWVTTQHDGGVWRVTKYGAMY